MVRNRSLWMFIGTSVFCGAFLIMAGSAVSAEDDIVQCRKELVATKGELDICTKKLLESPKLVALEKESGELNISVRSKEKELADIMDTKLNKNATYLALVAKSAELDKINADLRKRRTSADGDPEVQKLRKESADLRAKADALAREAAKLVDSKFNSDRDVKDLMARKAGIESAPKEAVDLKAKVMTDPQVKTLLAELTDLRSRVSAKNGERARAKDALFKGDEKFIALDLKLKELSKKLDRLQAAKPGAPAKAAPAEQPAKKSTGAKKKR